MSSNNLLIWQCTRMQGGLLVDGFAVLLSGAAGTAPSVSYCMNGFIAISRVASRGSGAVPSLLCPRTLCIPSLCLLCPAIACMHQ